MEEAIQKADVLIEALQWIRQFRGKITVIKLGGSIMEDHKAMVHLLLDVVFMETVGMRPVVVHGGGPAINRAMDTVGLQPRFVQGRRHTDTDTLAVVERVLAGEVNRKIAQQINELGGQARPLNFGTKNVLFGRRASVHDERGTPLDLGYVGVVTRVDRDSIVELCNAGVVPVIPSMCVTEDGQKLNVNADTAATAVAQALEAEKLVYLSDINGVRRNQNDPDSLIHSLTADEAQKLISDGSINSGMIPKVQACLETLGRGVHKVHIIDGRLRHSLLLEVYTNKGVGTQIVRNSGIENRDSGLEV
ncbi:MAG: acetylglutamate kinase [Pirellulales bacterium]|nr:acetylglutamate kinase [Pirellulales bacterium]